LEDMFVIKPAHPWWQGGNWLEGKPLADGFRFASNSNSQWITVNELKHMVETLL